MENFQIAIGVDFERDFFTAAGLFFPEVHSVGCLFHFKQAARRKMIDLGIPECEIQIAMQFGVYDLLTVLPKDDLDKKGIPFIQTMIMDFLGEYYMTNKPGFNFFCSLLLDPRYQLNLMQIFAFASWVLPPKAT